MTDVTQVYIVTSGSYSDYGINEVWLTLEEAQASVDSHETAHDWHVEVWPVGKGERTIGSFTRSVYLDATTGEPIFPEYVSEFSVYDESERRVAVLCWEHNNQIGIRVTETTRERADKVFGETKFRVFAEIAQGLPKELIAESKWVNGKWESTK